MIFYSFNLSFECYTQINLKNQHSSKWASDENISSDCCCMLYALDYHNEAEKVLNSLKKTRADRFSIVGCLTDFQIHYYLVFYIC
jgi:hypothetical protein